MYLFSTEQHSECQRLHSPQVSILEAISVLHPDKVNVVKFFEMFKDMVWTCLVFEMLDMHLYDLIEERDGKPLCLQEIRPIAQQLLVALDALKSLGIIHTDIKPDNIMMVHKQSQTLRVKLIDFGEAMLASKAEPTMEAQPIGYRSPEIALGLPFHEAIDVWGVGCILAFLYLADHLFQVHCEYQTMKSMVEVLGQPRDCLLNAGLLTKLFFCEKESSWRLLRPVEYRLVSGMYAEEHINRIEQPTSLDDLFYPRETAAEYVDRKAFVDLLKKLLHLEGDLRISPHQALQHPFITTSHLVEQCHSKAYLTTAQSMMDLLEDSADRVNTPAALKPDQGSATGSCSPSDDGSANGTFKGTTDPVSFVDGPESDTSDQGVYSDDDDDDLAPEEVLSLLPFDKDQAARTDDEEIQPHKDTVSFENDPTLGSSCEEDSAMWSSDDDLTWVTYDEDLAMWSSVEDLTSVTYDEDLAMWSSDDDDVSSLSSEDLASLSSHIDGPPPSLLSSDGASSRDSWSASSASSGRKRKTGKRIQRFFRRVTEAFCCCCCVED
ncbi:homeodomain-interacting protein kinase 3-like [Notolabrus celidotus]|uniref:homeodomain-interacting protein kinase 3-like n=1 Tax=Notolabrus celidotus TaxID=1203425 RepID=UPI00148FFBC4|nr:homeodomain-interacting protein kinase 3-like [Notolabrus celidotus]